MTDQEYGVSSSGIDIAALNLEIYRLEERRDWIQRELLRIKQESEECDKTKTSIFGKEQELEEFVIKTLSSIRQKKEDHPDIIFFKRIEDDVSDVLKGHVVKKLFQSYQDMRRTIQNAVVTNDRTIESLSAELREIDLRLQQHYVERSKN